MSTVLRRLRNDRSFSGNVELSRRTERLAHRAPDRSRARISSIRRTRVHRLHLTTLDLRASTIELGTPDSCKLVIAQRGIGAVKPVRASQRVGQLGALLGREAKSLLEKSLRNGGNVSRIAPTTGVVDGPVRGL